MSKLQWVISALIGVHIVAITIAAIPRHDDSDPPPKEVFIPHRPLAVSTLAPVFDRLAIRAERMERALITVTAPLKPLADYYDSWGLDQQWMMFSDPWTGDEYYRIDYVLIAPDSASRQVLRQLVLPAQSEDLNRLTHAFTDKAVIRTVDAYVKTVGTKNVREGALHLAPLLRHFEHAVHERLAGRKIVRVELWRGTAPIPAPGEGIPPQLAHRLDLLQRYRDAAVVTDSYSGDAGMWEHRREADINWQLIYLEWK